MIGESLEQAESGEAAVAGISDDRRLGDRILAALQLALDQGQLEIAEHLASALELAMTRYGGPAAMERRDVPDGLDDVFLQLDALRRGA